MQPVTYRGSEQRSPLTTHEAYEVEHGGKTYRLEEGVEQQVPNDLAAALSKVEGHDFDLGTKKGD